MSSKTAPTLGTKERIMWDLFTGHKHPAREQLRKATGWLSWGSFRNSAIAQAERYGGIARWEGKGPSRTFWIERP